MLFLFPLVVLFALELFLLGKIVGIMVMMMVTMMMMSQRLLKRGQTQLLINFSKVELVSGLASNKVFCKPPCIIQGHLAGLRIDDLHTNQ